MSLRIEVKDVSLGDLEKSHTQGFIGKIYLVNLEVPVEFLQRKEPGPLMAFNVNHKELYDFLLGAKRTYLTRISDDTALLSVELGEGYLPINLDDLKKVQGAVLVIED